MDTLTNQLIPVTPGRRWGTPKDASAVMGVHRIRSFAIRSSVDRTRKVNSLILSFHDFTYAVFFFSVSWRQIWPNRDNLLRLSELGSKSSQPPTRTLTCCHVYSSVSLKNKVITTRVLCWSFGESCTIVRRIASYPVNVLSNVLYWHFRRSPTVWLQFKRGFSIPRCGVRRTWGICQFDSSSWCSY